jgi:predicted PurR-regulated permease PerM
MTLSFRQSFYALATVFALFAIMILAKPVLIPLSFALLIAFILFPVARRFEKWGTNRIMSTVFSLLSLVLVIVGGIFLFSNQIINLADNFSDFEDKILGIFTDVTVFFNKNIPIGPRLERGELLDKLKSLLSSSVGKMANQTFNSTVSILTGLLTTSVFAFLILLYRDGLVNAFIHFFSEENRPRARHMFKSVQKVGQKYFSGMLLIILILGFVNSIGLMIIGIDSPFLFGFLAAILAIVPYVGTIAGAAIPILYAFITYDSIWMPISIGLYFWFVQTVESNFLTPKIVGGNLQVNALVSILSIIIGASVWGIAGMILFLPFAAMLRVICQEYIELRPVALLLGDFGEEKDPNRSNWFTNKIKQLKAKFSR